MYTSYVNGADGDTEAITQSNLPTTTYNLWGNDNIGKVIRNGTMLTRYYYLKDHLGSVRMTVDAAGVRQSWNDYYPYGLLMDDRNGVYGDTDPRYKFTGKERDVETQYDYFGFRYYDSRIGRWLSVDPMAEKYAGWSVYGYGSDNPTIFVDPDGRAVDEFRVDREQGTIVKVSNKGGSETDYYNVGRGDGKGGFGTEQVIVAKRGQGTINSFRFWESSISTISAFNIPGTNVSGNILEPPGPSTAVADMNQRIPEGVYNVMENDGTKFPGAYKIYNDIVSPERGIVFHLGNFPKDTEGCLLPGKGWQANYIEGGTSARMASRINRYISKVGAQNVRVRIFKIMP